jgi:hypothetical protein
LVGAGELLVEQKDVCVLCEGTGEKSALLLTAGKRADLPFGQIDEADCAQRVGFAETPPDAGKIPIDHAALRQIGDVRIRSDFSVTAENNRSGFLRH